jgi:ribosomal protein S18 acetylase RimI-like enzyme
MGAPLDIDAMRRGAEAPQITTDIAGAQAAADDLTAAFMDDPVFDWLSRTDAKRPASRQRFFRFLVSQMVLGIGEVQRPAAGGAAALWMPFEALGPNPLIKELQALPMLLGLTGWGRFGRLVQLRDVMDKHHPMDRPHEYLWFIGVRPDVQGHGVGSRLLKSKLDQLDASGRAAYLEASTESNMRLYARHGFEVVAEWRPAPDGPPSWSMWREPGAGDGGA